MTQENNKEMPRLIRLREVNSTNAYIQSLNRDERLPEGSVVWADFQTAGRGQIGNVWESENGKNLTFSIVFYPSFLLAKHQFLISQIASLSVKETLDEFISGITVKWPNDVYWNDKKICGMLIENDLAGQYIYSSVIGIGININQAVFRGDAPNPVSLYQILGREVDIEDFMHRFLGHIYDNYLTLMKGDPDGTLVKKYLDSLYRKEGFFLYVDKNGQFEAEFAGIEPTGHLLLRLKDQTARRYEFKEVKFITSVQ